MPLDAQESLGRIEHMEAKTIQDIAEDIAMMLLCEHHHLSDRMVFRAGAILEMAQANLLSLQLQLEDAIYKSSQKAN